MCKSLKNRYTPFGYCIKKGRIEIVPYEAEVIKRIFSEYVAGKSLKSIAELLSESKVQYIPNEFQWNKNRVARIISDERYRGNDLYEAIIDEDTFNRAKSVKISRNTQQSYEKDTVISSSVTNIVCGKCSCTTRRISDRRRKWEQKYLCTNPECRATYEISDKKMIKMLSRIIDASRLLFERSITSDSFLEIHRMEMEISRLLDGSNIDYDKVEKLIFECANKKYQLESKDRSSYDKLRRELDNPQFTVNRHTVMELVSCIKLIDNDKIEVTLINGQIMNGE